MGACQTAIAMVGHRTVNRRDDGTLHAEPILPSGRAERERVQGTPRNVGHCVSGGRDIVKNGGAAVFDLEGDVRVAGTINPATGNIRCASGGGQPTVYWPFGVGH
jgi:hypothetical protein